MLFSGLLRLPVRAPSPGGPAAAVVPLHAAPVAEGFRIRLGQRRVAARGHAVDRRDHLVARGGDVFHLLHHHAAFAIGAEAHQADVRRVQRAEDALKALLHDLQSRLRDRLGVVEPVQPVARVERVLVVHVGRRPADLLRRIVGVRAVRAVAGIRPGAVAVQRIDLVLVEVVRAVDRLVVHAARQRAPDALGFRLGVGLPLRRGRDRLETVTVDDPLRGHAQEIRRVDVASCVAAAAQAAGVRDWQPVAAERRRGALPVDRVAGAAAGVLLIRIVRGLRRHFRAHAARRIHDEQDVGTGRHRLRGRLAEVDLDVVRLDGQRRTCGERRREEGVEE